MIRSSDTNRPQVWEDEAPAETRFRRVQQGVPPSGRKLPGMPLEMTDPDGDDVPRRGKINYTGQRFGAPRSRWWRPASTWGRVLLGLCVLIVLGGIATAAIFLRNYLTRDARFRIAGADNIEAGGLTQVSRADMLPVFGEDIGRNVFFVPLAERRKQLEQVPWIERATVMRVLPNQIRVEVSERKPVAFVRQGQQIGLVDADGVLLNMPPASMAQHHYSFPVVTGIKSEDSPAARKARMAVYQRLVSELDAGTQHLSQQISEIDLTDPEDARVLMPEQGGDILAHFGEDRFLERYQRYKERIVQWRQQYPKLAAVDLRYDQQVVLEMAQGASPTEASADSQPPANSADAKPPAPDLAKKTAVKPATRPAGKKAAKPATKPRAKTSKPGEKTATKPKSVVMKQDRKRAEPGRTAPESSTPKNARAAAYAAVGQ